MDKDSRKKIICFILMLVFVGLTVLFALVDINVAGVSSSSVNGVIEKREELLKLETDLETAEKKYSESKEKLVQSQSDFTSAKNKYEAISDETINLIREATTEENYDIEYMWIKLGNYATANNLSIIMVEPGGKATVQSTTDNENTSTNTTTTTATSPESSSELSDEMISPNSNATTSSEASSTTSNSDTIMTITLQGSYLNISDFIFEIENDKELRFKLDNIEMTYVEGTTIRTKFDVKNIIVLK